MGWSTTRRDRACQSDKTDKSFLEKKFGPKYVLHGIAKTGKAVYAAMSMKDSPEDIFAVIMVYMWGDFGGDHNFAFKFVDETMGPSADECPSAILDLLTSTDDERAKAWRAACYRKAGCPMLTFC